MKKFLTAIAAATLALCFSLGFAACDDKEKTPDDQDTTTTEEEQKDPSQNDSDTATPFGVPANVKIEGTVLKWDKVEGATSYTVKIGDKTKTVTGKNELDLTTTGYLERGINHVSVMTNGSNKRGGSDYSQAIDYTHKEAFAAPTGLKVEGDHIEWTAVENATGYTLKVNDEETTTANTSVTLAELGEKIVDGKNTISVKTNANDTLYYLESAYSDSVLYRTDFYIDNWRDNSPTNHGSYSYEAGADEATTIVIWQAGRTGWDHADFDVHNLKSEFQYLKFTVNPEAAVNFGIWHDGTSLLGHTSTAAGIDTVYYVNVSSLGANFTLFLYFDGGGAAAAADNRVSIKIEPLEEMPQTLSLTLNPSGAEGYNVQAEATAGSYHVTWSNKPQWNYLLLTVANYNSKNKFLKVTVTTESAFKLGVYNPKGVYLHIPSDSTDHIQIDPPSKEYYLAMPDGLDANFTFNVYIDAGNTTSGDAVVTFELTETNS